MNLFKSLFALLRPGPAALVASIAAFVGVRPGKRRDTSSGSETDSTVVVHVRVLTASGKYEPADSAWVAPASSPRTSAVEVLSSGNVTPCSPGAPVHLAAKAGGQMTVFAGAANGHIKSQTFVVHQKEQHQFLVLERRDLLKQHGLN